MYNFVVMKNILPILLATVALYSSHAPAFAASPTAASIPAAAGAILAKSGVSFQTTHFGVLFMGYPFLDGERHIDAAVTNNTATVAYANGAEIIFTADTNALYFSFATLPPEVAEYKIELHLSGGLGARGTKWMVAGKFGNLPRDSLDPDSGQILFEGIAHNLTLISPTGAAFAIRFPETENTKTVFKDNREFSRVIYSRASPLPPGASAATFIIPYVTLRAPVEN